MLPLSDPSQDLSPYRLANPGQLRFGGKATIHVTGRVSVILDFPGRKRVSSLYYPTGLDIQAYPEGALSVGKLLILKEIWGFLRARKKWWLLPIVMMLLLMAGVLLLTEGSAIAPFIYALF